MKNERCKNSSTSSSLDEFLRAVLYQTELSFEILDENYISIRRTNSLGLEDLHSNKESICGTIIDEETGEALAFANIIIKGTNIGTGSDENGEFNLTHEFSKEDILLVSYIGYETLVINKQSFNVDDCLELKLTLPTELDPFLIVTDYILDGIRLDNNGSSTELNPDLISNIPGYIEPDIMGIAKLLPGISSPNSKASDIYIRGGTPDQNLIVWEDIPIYHSAHYFGMISAFNPFIVDDMEIYRGGFGAEYGGRVAGVIDLKSADEAARSSKFGFGSNLTHAYIYGHQKFDLFEQSAITFSVRRSFEELIETPTFKNISTINQQGYLLGNTEVNALPDHITVSDDFSFIDSHLKFSALINPKNRVELSSFLVDNAFEGQITDDVRGEAQGDEMSLRNLGVSLRWNYTWNKRLNTSITGVSTSYEYDYNYSLKRFNSMENKLSGVKSNMIQDRQIQVNNFFTMKNNQIYEFGYHLIDYNLEFDIQEESNSSKDINDSNKTDSPIHSLYLTFKNPIQNKVGLNLGIRSSYFVQNKSVYLEPRIRLAYKINDEFSLNANYGRYHQFVSQITTFRGNDNGISTPLWTLATSESLPVQRADLIQFGTLFKKNKWVVDWQFYRRNIIGLSSRAYELEDLEGVKQVLGKAYINGMDILVKKNFGVLRSWLSYSISKTDFQFSRISDVRFPADYDQRHVFQFYNQVEYKSLEFSLGYSYSSGLPYSKIIGWRSVNRPDQMDEIVAEYDGVNNYRLEDMHELNLSVKHQFSNKKNSWNAHLCFSITNLLDTENLFSRNYFLDTPASNGPNISQVKIIEVDKTRLKFTPNLSLRFEW